MGKRSRKRRGGAAGGGASRGGASGGATSGGGRGASASPSRSRSESKNEAAREKLVPLAEGERPVAVTVAAAVAGLLGLANLVAYAAGVEINDERPAVTGVASYSALMFLAAYGSWRARYWAVLGVEALLAILIVVFGVLVFEASNVATVAICVAVMGSAGALFYFLVKAMARIQMPQRPTR
ncbi:MAG TPA: hypothetical protein VF520_11080 [Thermoleophilaceae bacterium]